MVDLQLGNSGVGKVQEALVQHGVSTSGANDPNTKDPFPGCVASKDTSSDPSSVSSYRTGPHYQYFDLGDTQTQEGDLESHFQKETTPKGSKKSNAPLQATPSNNGHGSTESGRGAPALYPTSPRPTTRAYSNPTHRNMPSAPYKPLPLSRSAKDPSPTKLTSPPPSRSSLQRNKPSSRRTTPPRFQSSSPTGQDSFERPAPFEDPAKVFVAPIRVFDEPLSQWLGSDTQPADTEPPPVSHGSSSAVMEQLSPQGEGSPSRGSVLVDDTPSNPEHAQPQDRRLEKPVFQDIDGDVHAQDTDAYSLDLSQGWTPPDVPTAGSSPRTQELVPTQIVYPADINMNISTEHTEQTAPQLLGKHLPSAVPEPHGTYGPQTQVDDSLYAPTQVIPPGGLTQLVDSNGHTQPHISHPETTQVVIPSDRYTQATMPVAAKARKTAQQNGDELFNYLQQQRQAAHGTGDATYGTSVSPPSPGDGHGRYTDVVPDSEPGRTQPTPGPSRSIDDDSDEDFNNPFKVMPAFLSSAKVQLPVDKEDDEDDVPLASVRRRQSRSPPSKRQRPRGSSLIKEVPFPKPKSTTKAPSPASPLKGKQPVSTTSKAASSRKWKAIRESAPAPNEPQEIPSSVPLQDHAPNDTIPFTRAINPRSKSSTNERKETPSSSSANAARGPISSPALLDFGSPLSPPPDDDSIAPETQDPLDLISHAKDDEKTTEPAHEPMDVDEDVKPSARKRKRSGPKPSTRAAAGSAKVPSSTPSTKTNKRLKGQTSTVRSVMVEHTRVFALWKQNALYYSGKVKLPSSKANRFVVAFDDETEAEVDISQMRRCELHVGDEVVLIEVDKRATVVNVNQFAEDGIVRVQMDESGPVLDVKPSGVKISTRSITAQWKDRMLTMEDIMAIKSSKSLQVTPSPSRTSTHSASKPLARVGFVFTTSTTGSEREKEEEKIKHALTGNGGILLDNWKEIYHVSGKHDSGKRWTITPDDIHYKQKGRIGQVFLLADDANQKPKYLEALALGIPCLDVDWLYTDRLADVESSWKTALLPAGYSDRLNARVSQLIDLDWGSSPAHLSDIMANTVAPKVFTGKSILVAGPDYFPLAKGRKNSGQSSDNNDASREVPTIILFMGAERVETVKDAEHASASLKEYDYIVVKEVEDKPKGKGKGKPKEKGTYVSVEWVKDCLISARLLSIP